MGPRIGPAVDVPEGPAKQGSSVTTVHTLSLIGIIAGAAPVIAGIVVRSTRGRGQEE